MRSRVIRIYGIVQGVGFRPFVSRLANRLGVKGSVANKGAFVEIHAQGDDETLTAFESSLEKEPPPRAVILKRESHELEDEPPASSFDIIDSEKDRGPMYVSPDIATCDRCRQELYDPTNRRYLHPFINCTACGPRLTILEEMPYDRERTTMKTFPMCDECRWEYTHSETRRFDAQPVCCHDCGPQVWLLNRPERGMAAIREARRLIREGRIVAVKGIGGFHLACDARQDGAVRRLRQLKHRPAKPFAVMFSSLQSLERMCEATSAERDVLTGHQKPIVLLRRRLGAQLAASVAPGTPYVGAFLPYAPVQMLLFDCHDGEPMTDALVMTSGNVSGAPICRSDEDAQRELSRYCDAILTHDRPILLRADDSVMDFLEGRPYMIRRSRGYSPLPFWQSEALKGDVLGIGGELKNCFCIGKGSLFYPSPYIGDMEDMRTVNALRESVTRLSALLEVRPSVVACDLHPRYNSVLVAEELGIPVLRVQHHYAHVLSCMAEHDVHEDVIGVSFDGTGYGTDGSIWGGEILRCGVQSFERLNHISPFWQPGGDASAREGWRIAVSLLHELYPQQEKPLSRVLELCSEQEAGVLTAMVERRVHAVLSTSAGRLFDAVAAILGLCRSVSFEGEAAMALQMAAETSEPTELEEPVTDTMALVKAIVERRLRGEDVPVLARRFHDGLASFIVNSCLKARRETGLTTVALSGGVFQNRVLTERAAVSLRQEGFRVLLHSMIPPNDGGIALGQAVYASRWLTRRGGSGAEAEGHR